MNVRIAVRRGRPAGSSGTRQAFAALDLDRLTAEVADWFGLMGRPWGPSALVDQQLGGSVAWGIGELPTLALAIGVAFAWSRDDERTARRRDRRVDRAGDPELDEYNAMLERLSARDDPR